MNKEEGGSWGGGVKPVKLTERGKKKKEGGGCTGVIGRVERRRYTVYEN